MTYLRRFVCLSCGSIDDARFFRRWKVGRVWREKCEHCSLSLPDGKCAYTEHMIIFNPRTPSKIRVG